MKVLDFDSKFFSPKDTLECGQVFRFTPYKDGYRVFSANKDCYVYVLSKKTIIESDYIDYFYNYFDLDTNYEKIYNDAINSGYEILKKSAEQGKGIRILNQNKEEALYHFIISQNNNIPRIKLIIEKLSQNYGDSVNSPFGSFKSFPTSKQMESLLESDFKNVGLGYRANYFYELKNKVNNGYSIENLASLDDESLYKELLSIKGVGPKVANCVQLFGFHRNNSFPVDTWIEKIYHEDFKGELKDIKKITKYFVNLFKENSGMFQQYLFNYKRNIEKEEK